MLWNLTCPFVLRLVFLLIINIKLLSWCRFLGVYLSCELLLGGFMICPCVNCCCFFCKTVFFFFLCEIFELQGHHTSTQRPSTVTVFAVEASGNLFTDKLTLLRSHTMFNEAGLRARRVGSLVLCRWRRVVGFDVLLVGRDDRREQADSKVLVQKKQNWIAGTTCIPGRSLLHFSRKQKV